MLVVLFSFSPEDRIWPGALQFLAHSVPVDYAIDLVSNSCFENANVVSLLNQENLKKLQNDFTTK